MFCRLSKSFIEHKRVNDRRDNDKLNHTCDVYKNILELKATKL